MIQDSESSKLLNNNENQTSDSDCATDNPIMEKSNTILAIVYINVILYATCYQIQKPLEPFLVQNLLGEDSKSASVDEYAKLQSFFSVVQTVGSLISGYFLDHFGPKGGFIISFGASGLSYWILSKATTMNILYLSKIPTVFQSGFLCAQLAATLVTKDGAERVQALGRLTMAYTVGMVIGPSLGGILGASGDYYFGATLAVYGSILSILLTFLLPNFGGSTNREKDKESNTTFSSSSGSNSNTGLMQIIRLVWLFLGTKVVTSLANSTSATAMPLILKNIYHMNERSLGYCMSAMSAFNAVVNGTLLGPIVSYLDNNLSTVVKYCLIFMAGFSFLQAFFSLPSVVAYSPQLSAGLGEYIVCLFVISIFQYVLASALTSESTARVEPHAKGTLLGMEHSLFAAARTFTPQVGVWLLKNGGVLYVSSTCGFIFAIVLVCWNSFIHRFPELKQGKHSVEERKGR